MKLKEIEKKLSNIDLPIFVDGSNNPRQLELYLKGKCIARYDPVYSIKVIKKYIFIEGFISSIYKHNIEEFDDIKVIKYKNLLRDAIKNRGYVKIKV